MSPPITYSVTLSVPETDTRVYRTAARILAGKLGAAAPSAEELILLELSGRTAGAIAEEYLHSIGHAGAAPKHRRKVIPAKRRTTHGRKRRR